jgi:3-phosphoshikimate 1-carboxyvinyltransferase
VNVFTATPAAAGVHGRIRVPGDKSISHRALLLAARAEGGSRLTGLSQGLDVVCTRRAVAAFGAGVSVDPDGSVVVEGGARRLHEPQAVIDVGNSGTGIRLLAGWAAGIDGLSVLAGDESVARRPMDRVVEPLRLMGCRVDGRDGGRLPPLVVRGGGLRGIDYPMPVASAQVKGSILLAGLCAEGPTVVRETRPTRMHTEEMLGMCGAAIEVVDGVVRLEPGPLKPVDFDVPGDPSQAAFWIVAACISEGSDLTVERVYVGPGRAGFLDVLRRMGADIEVTDHDLVSSTATVRARHSALHATDVTPAEVPALIDEIPILAVAAACAEGVTTFAGASELRVKETDRIETIVSALQALGVDSESRPDGLVVHGSANGRLGGGEVTSAGDHRIGMALAVAGLASKAPVVITGWEAVATSYPGFEDDYRKCAGPNAAAEARPAE